MNDFTGGAPIGPFPLQTNLRKLKPNLGGVVLPILTLFVFALQGPLEEFEWNDLGSWKGYLIAGVVTLAILAAIWLISELALKRIFYNEKGVGIVRAGSSPTWYSFDEMKEAKVQQGVSSRKRDSSTLKLYFHTGTVVIRGVLYDKAQVQRLTAIVKNRMPAPMAPESAPTGPDPAQYGQSKPSKSEKAPKQKMPKRGVYPTGDPFSLPDVKPPEIKPPKKR
jgi:hypothetical protein